MLVRKQNRKRGFTVSELVVVISVIAILSAVLIPTFTGIVGKSKLSADEQVVRSLNLELATADADEIENLDEVTEYLSSLDIDISNYAPIHKGNKFAYSAGLKKFVLVNAAGQIVYPKEYVNESVTVEKVDGKDDVIVELENADDIALVVASRGGDVTISNNLKVDTAMYVTKNVTVQLTADISAPNDTVGDGVFCVKKNTLTLNGNGTVNGKGKNDYNMALWADGGNIVINGGTYTNEGATGADSTHFDLIYVKNGGKVTINGGTFKCETPDWTLNSHDTAKGSIVIAGGKFYKFNPANLPDNLSNDDIKLADGYTVVQNGDWYEVVKA